MAAQKSIPQLARAAALALRKGNLARDAAEPGWKKERKRRLDEFDHICSEIMPQHPHWERKKGDPEVAKLLDQLPKVRHVPEAAHLLHADIRSGARAKKDSVCTGGRARPRARVRCAGVAPPDLADTPLRLNSPPYPPIPARVRKQTQVRQELGYEDEEDEPPATPEPLRDREAASGAGGALMRRRQQQRDAEKARQGGTKEAAGEAAKPLAEGARAGPKKPAAPAQASEPLQDSASGSSLLARRRQQQEQRRMEKEASSSASSGGSEGSAILRRKQADKEAAAAAKEAAIQEAKEEAAQEVKEAGTRQGPDGRQVEAATEKAAPEQQAGAEKRRAPGGSSLAARRAARKAEEAAAKAHKTEEAATKARNEGAAPASAAGERLQPLPPAVAPSGGRTGAPLRDSSNDGDAMVTPTAPKQRSAAFGTTPSATGVEKDAIPPPPCT